MKYKIGTLLEVKHFKCYKSITKEMPDYTFWIFDMNTTRLISPIIVTEVFCLEENPKTTFQIYKIKLLDKIKHFLKLQ